ncbi:MAG: isochorismatase family protein [Neisseriaceae bacterium]|nr:isochorismatase family protein [Neisseriaceae bacterium]
MTIIAIDVDAQRTFSPLCPNELPVPHGDEIVSELNLQAKLADFRVMTKDAHSQYAVWAVNSSDESLKPLNYANADLSWLRHAEVGSDGFELLPNLPLPIEYDFLVYKGVEKDMHPYGACFHDLAGKISTGLIEWLKNKGATHIIVGGLATDYCVKNTVLQLLSNGDWKVFLNLAASRGIADDTVMIAIDEMKNNGAIICNNAQEIKEILSKTKD